MTKNKLILGGIIVVLLLIVGYLMANRADAPSEVTGDTNTEQGTEQSLGDRMSDTAKSSIGAMLALGKSQTCSYTNTSNGTESKGTVFMSGGKMRGDFTSTVNGKNEVTHMISDGKESRVWIDGQPNGYLMRIPDAPTASSPDTAVSSNVSTQNQMPINMDEDASAYNCTSWNTDASVFVPPTNVEFVSMDDMMKGIMPSQSTPPSPGSGQTSPGASGGGSAGYDGGASYQGGYDNASMKVQQCAMCEQVKDPASKAECRAAFQCQ